MGGVSGLLLGLVSGGVLIQHPPLLNILYLKAFQAIFLFLRWVLHTKIIVVKNSIEKGCFSASNTSFLGQRYDEEKCEDRYGLRDCPLINFA